MDNDFIENRKGWLNIIKTITIASPSTTGHTKTFHPKFDIPKLENYRVSDLGDEYWNKWPSNFNRVGVSRIDGDTLVELAKSTGLNDMVTLSKIQVDLEEGARIGC